MKLKFKVKSSVMLPYLKICPIQTNKQLINILENKRCVCVCVCVCVSDPAGLESDTGCSCMVSSPSLVKAAPAAEKISPTCSEEDDVLV